MRKGLARFYLGVAAMVSALGLVFMLPAIQGGKLTTLGLGLFFGAPGWAALLMQYQDIGLTEAREDAQDGS
jgi:hypothetical protein